MPPRRQTTDEPASKRRERAPVLPFVTFENETFSVNEEAAAFLEGLGPQPLGVASLAGPYRHGKSFLLNRVLLQYGPGIGFPVGHTVNACTKGLHISTQLLTDHRRPNGAPVLIMDTEGLGAVSATDTHDMRIFSLALLLSSTFLYNSKGTIDQPAINNLALVTSISEHIRVSSSTSTANELADFFPAFLWIVRDFALELVDESGKALAADEYLENALRPVDHASPEKNKVRDRLRTLFKHRGCVTMIRPCDDEQALKTLNDLPTSALKPAFVEQSAALRSMVLQRTQPAQVQGMTMTGPLLVRLARLYVDAINRGAAPAIKDSWSLISSDECQKAMHVAEQEFQKVLAELRVDGSALDRHHQRKAISASALESAFTQGFEKALALYKQRAMGDRADEFRERLREALRTRANKLRAENIQIVARKAESVVEEFERTLMNYGTFEELRTAFSGSESVFYKETGVDPGSRAAWYECVSKHVWEWAGRFFAKQSTDYALLQGQLPLMQQQLQSQTQSSAALLERAESAETNLQSAEEQLAELETCNKQLHTELSQCMEELDTIALADRSAQADHNEKIASSEAEIARLHQQISLLNADIHGKTNTLADTESKNAILQSQLVDLADARKSSAEWEQKFRDIEDSRALLQRRVSELTAHLNKAAHDHEREIQQLNTSTGDVIMQLSQLKDDAEERAKSNERLQRETAEQMRRDIATKESAIQRLEQDLQLIKNAQKEERAEHKAELSEVRGEASRNAKQFQRQLEEQASQSREDARKRASKMREEVDKLFQEKVTAAGRAQQMETRAIQAEDALREVQALLHQERERVRDQNLSGKIAMLEANANTAQARFDLLQATLQEKNDIVAEQQSQITDLEAELRQIQQRHEAEKLRIQLEFARKLGSKS